MKLDSRWSSEHHYIFPCDCHDWHFIEVSWDDTDVDWRFLEVTDTYAPRRLRDRLRAAFTILRSKPHYHSSVILDDKNLHELIEVLTKHHDAQGSAG